jgi:FkbM family methyltransferase
VFSLEKSLSRLAGTGFEIHSAIDIGANVGQWFWTFRTYFPNVDVFSVEANPENMVELTSMNPNSANLCLFEREGENVEFFLPDPSITRCNTGASIYRENGLPYNQPRIARLVTTTLDLLERKCDFIKLEVQGAELDILRGGLDTLATAKIVQVELSILKYNQNAPLLAEVIAFLHAHDFLAFDITEVMLHEGRPMQIDMLFANRSLSELVTL